MGDLIDLIGVNKTGNSIEIGQVLSGKGNNSYVVSIGNVEYVAISAISNSLKEGHKVVVLKTGIGKRYITGFLSLVGKKGLLKEIIING